MKPEDFEHFRKRLDQLPPMDPSQRGSATFVICEEWLLGDGAEKVRALKEAGHL